MYPATRSMMMFSTGSFHPGGVIGLCSYISQRIIIMLQSSRVKPSCPAAYPARPWMMVQKSIGGFGVDMIVAPLCRAFYLRLTYGMGVYTAVPDLCDTCGDLPLTFRVCTYTVFFGAAGVPRQLASHTFPFNFL